jgi:hypothetical protein
VVAGSAWRTGIGLPSNTLGVDTDYYLDDATDNVYLKTNGVYVLAANIKGSTGLQGPAGPAGASGSVWRTGVGAPLNTLGVNGDYYLNTSTSDVHFKAAGVYSVTVNIKGAVGPAGPTSTVAGPQGPTGPAGAQGPVGVTGVGTSTGVLDLSLQQVFTISATTSRTISFINAPNATRAMVVAVNLVGTGGVITWPSIITWADGIAPTLAATITVVVLYWTGTQWVGVVSANV